MTGPHDGFTETVWLKKHWRLLVGVILIILGDVLILMTWPRAHGAQEAPARPSNTLSQPVREPTLDPGSKEAQHTHDALRVVGASTVLRNGSDVRSNDFGFYEAGHRDPAKKAAEEYEPSQEVKQQESTGDKSAKEAPDERKRSR